MKNSFLRKKKFTSSENINFYKKQNNTIVIDMHCYVGRLFSSNRMRVNVMGKLY